MRCPNGDTCYVNICAMAGKNSRPGCARVNISIHEQITIADAAFAEEMTELRKEKDRSVATAPALDNKDR